MEVGYEIEAISMAKATQGISHRWIRTHREGRWIGKETLPWLLILESRQTVHRRRTGDSCGNITCEPRYHWLETHYTGTQRMLS